MATNNLVQQVLTKHKCPEGLLVSMVGSGATVGNLMINDKRIQLISFTGSTQVGKTVQQKVGDRFGKTILELGGNNACIVLPDADIQMAL
jgi:acyl-CoA reductase-like NAD-dependent aldehyde dehydrogenase